jgi:hypothetical protein
MVVGLTRLLPAMRVRAASKKARSANNRRDVLDSIAADVRGPNHSAGTRQ